MKAPSAQLEGATYRCFPYFFQGRRAIWSFFGFLIGPAWLLPLFALTSTQAPLLEILKFSTAVSVTMVLGALIANTLNDEIINTRYQIAHARCTKKSPGTLASIAFENVTYVGKKKILFLTFGCVVRSRKGEIFLPVIIDQLPRLLEQIVDGVSRAGAESAINREEIVDSMILSRTNQRVTDIIYECLPDLGIQSRIYMIIGLIAARFYWYLILPYAFGFMIFSGIVPIAVFLFFVAPASVRIKKALLANGDIPSITGQALLAKSTVLTIIGYFGIGVVIQQLL
ncbi:MAG: hypothetical protein GF398_06200 [Chitinivibrionales bacterium]|nr:hypothetical protein [Chitinivibrionales bacterium]